MKIKLWQATLIFNVFLIVAFSALYFCFIPDFTDYVERFITVSLRAVIISVGCIIAVPCVVLLALSLSLSFAIKNDSVFTLKTAKRLAAVAYIMLFDCVLFFFGIAVLFCFGERLFVPLLAIIDLIGFALSILLLVLSGYIRRAAKLKEEVDSTL